MIFHCAKYGLSNIFIMNVLYFFVLHVVMSQPNQYVCNPTTNIQKDFIKSLKGSRPSLPEGCPDVSVKNLEELKKYLYDMHMKPTTACLAPEGINMPFCIPVNLFDHKQCNTPKALQYDWDNDLNVRIDVVTNTEKDIGQKEWKKLNSNLLVTDYIARILVEQTTTDYEVRKTNTLWNKFRFDANTLNNTACKDGFNCDNMLFSMPLILTDRLLQVQSQTFTINTGEPLNPGIIFDLSQVSRRNLVRGSYGYGFQTSGCSVPYFKIRIEWVRHSQVKDGSINALESFLRTPGRRLLEVDHAFVNYSMKTRHLLQSPTMDCWKRVIKIVDAYNPGANTVECKTPQSMNHMRFFQKERESMRLNLLKLVYSASTDLSLVVYYSQTYVKQLETCADAEVGSVWKGNSIVSPGYCGSCSSSGSIIVKQRNLVPRACRISAEDIGRECCFQCKPGYIQTFASQDNLYPTCIRSCLQGYRFTGHACVLCESGTFSIGGTSQKCASCSELGFINHRLLPRQGGCLFCGSRFALRDNKCVPCGPNEYVASGTDYCRECPKNKAYFLPLGLENTSCVLCPAGFRGDGSGNCEVCDTNFISEAGAFECTPCPNGYFASGNRSLCLKCPSLLNNLSEYYQPGCDYVRCIPSQAYAVGNPYNANGCASCKDLGSLPIGTYRPIDSDCSLIRTCENKPVNSVYTAPAIYPSATCDWKCQPGFYANVNSCMPCSSTGYDAARHVWTEGCEFTCRPLKFVDDEKKCDRDCVDLLDEEVQGRLFGRISEYGNKSRPNYVIGKCGTSARISIHTIPLIQLSRYAVVADVNFDTSIRCGNSVFNVGEECDDGNIVNGDGCSSLCRIERDNYWDCDVIGEQCMPNCGWPLFAKESWDVSLYGYVFPRSVGPHSCAGMAYNEIKRKPVGDRLKWMDANLISCDCFSNLFRQVQYSMCTPENKGCVECPPEHYYNDLRRECILCGQSCLPGFRKYPAELKLLSKCRNDTSYRYKEVFTVDYEADIVKEQSMIGCYPCQKPSTNPDLIRWLPGDVEQCQYQCQRDSTGTNTSLDTFCMGNVDIGNGACQGNGVCQLCSIRLVEVINSLSEYEKIGMYIKGCHDGDGYSWVPCDDSILPDNAVFSGYAQEIGDSKGCPWECALHHYLYEDMKCLPEFTYFYNENEPKHPCPKDSDALQPVSDGSLQLYVCAPCEGATPFAHQVWKTYPPMYDKCESECELGVSWRSAGDSYCILCSEITCSLGEVYRPCTIHNDAFCEPCTSTLNSSYSEYITEGNCAQRCISGYYQTPFGTCEACSQVCEPGYYRSSNCSIPVDRWVIPQCLQCPFGLDENERWLTDSSFCQKQCRVNYVFSSKYNRCVLCQASLCDRGFYGLCEDQTSEFSTVVLYTTLNCISCSEMGIMQSEGVIFSVNGSCDTECASGYALYGGGCRRQQTSINDEPVVTEYEEQFNSNMVDIVYPIRTMEHS